MDKQTSKQSTEGMKAMQAAAMNMNQLEEHYYEIVDLFDLAEELIATVESDFCKNQEEQRAVVEPLIEELEASAEILTEEYMYIVENNVARKPNGKVEGALRRIYTAIDAYHKRAEKAANEAVTGFRNLADPIVKKLVRQLEVVVASLVDFVELSIERIMTNHYAEKLRMHHEKISQMLHGIAQGAN